MSLNLSSFKKMVAKKINAETWNKLANNTHSINLIYLLFFRNPNAIMQIEIAYICLNPENENTNKSKPMYNRKNRSG